MPLAKLTPNLMVQDVARTAAYYQETLGFSFVMGIPEAGGEPAGSLSPRVPLAFAIMKSGGVEVFLQSRKSLTSELPVFSGQKIGGTLTLYIECDDLDERYARLAESAPFLKDLHETPYGMREFHIQDLNGYILAFAQKA